MGVRRLHPLSAPCALGLARRKKTPSVLATGVGCRGSCLQRPSVDRAAASRRCRLTGRLSREQPPRAPHPGRCALHAAWLSPVTAVLVPGHGPVTPTGSPAPEVPTSHWEFPAFLLPKGSPHGPGRAAAPRRVQTAEAGFNRAIHYPRLSTHVSVCELQLLKNATAETRQLLRVPRSLGTPILRCRRASPPSPPPEPTGWGARPPRDCLPPGSSKSPSAQDRLVSPARTLPEPPSVPL